MHIYLGGENQKFQNETAAAAASAVGVGGNFGVA